MDCLLVSDKTSDSNWIDDLPTCIKLYEIAKGLIAGPARRFDFNREWRPRDDPIKCIYSVCLFQPSEFPMANPQTAALKSGYAHVEHLERDRSEEPTEAGFSGM
jgi:hypothetical protein